MISDFSFENFIVGQSGASQSAPVQGESPMALQLPLLLPEQLLNLRGVAENMEAFFDHFSPLHLSWEIEGDRLRGGIRATAVLEADPRTGGVWALCVLERASTGRHRHRAGGAYGECVITLAGELDDVLDDGTAVKLRTGAVMFHAVDTIHEASTVSYWAGLYHQPHGSTLVV